MTNDINVDVSPVFVRNYQSKADVVCNQGGTRSGKTYSIVQTIDLKHLLQDTNQIIDIVRKTQSELKDSVIPDFEETLNNIEFGDSGKTLWDITEHKATRLEYRVNGNVVRFIGMDKAQKKRGSKRNILYINEANGITRDDWIQLSIRTSGVIYIDFNPSELFWINDLIFDSDQYMQIDSRTYDQERDNPKIKDEKTGRYKRKLTYEFIQSNYLDNLDFLTDRQIANIEALIGMDQYYEDVYVHGILAALKGTIYNNISIVEPHIWLEETKHAERFYGLDIGYDHHTVFIELCYHKEQIWSRCMYWERLKLDDDFLKWLMKSDISPNDDIYVDSAFPSWISKIRDKGYSARKSNKAVKDGIAFCQSIPNNICNDVISNKGRTNYILQMQKYKNKQLATGDIIDEPVKFEDDGPDAYRYGVYTHLRKRIHRIGIS